VDLSRLERVADNEWRINPVAAMRVPGIVYADADLIRGMDDKVYDQITNVATLPGIIKASYGLTRSDIEAHKDSLGDALFTAIPAGLGSTGTIRLNERGMQAMFTGGARWAVRTRTPVPV